MLVRNIGAPRSIASPTHDYYSDEVKNGVTVEVNDELGCSLCDQAEVWEPADDESAHKYAAHVRALERAAAEADKAEHPDESAKDRKARLKAEAEAAAAAEQEVN